MLGLLDPKVRRSRSGDCNPRCVRIFLVARLLNARLLPRDETGVTRLILRRKAETAREHLCSPVPALWKQGHTDSFIYGSSCPASRCECPCQDVSENLEDAMPRRDEKHARSKKERKEIQESYRSSPIRDIGILDPSSSRCTRYRVRV